MPQCLRFFFLRERFTQTSDSFRQMVQNKVWKSHLSMKSAVLGRAAYFKRSLTLAQKSTTGSLRSQIFGLHGFFYTWIKPFDTQPMLSIPRAPQMVRDIDICGEYKGWFTKMTQGPLNCDRLSTLKLFSLKCRRVSGNLTKTGGGLPGLSPTNIPFSRNKPQPFDAIN